MKNSQKHNQLGRSTFIVMIFTFFSRILGFVRTAVFSSVFGGGSTADVLNLVFSIPNNLRKLMAEGALSSAFIPVMTESVHAGDKNESSTLFISLVALQAVILIPLSILAVIFAPQIISFLFDFPIGEQLEMAIQLFRFFIHYTLLISISAVCMGTLHAHGKFTIPAITPLLFSISVISSILFLHSNLGVYSMVIGVLAGGLAQLLFQLPSLFRLGYGKIRKIDFHSPRFRLILRRWAPVVITSSIYTINQQISMFLASGLEIGSSTALLNALIFWQLPFGIFSASIATVYFPAMSKQAAEKDISTITQTVNRGIGSLFALLIPSAVFLIFLGKPAIAVALQRGAYTAQNTAMASQVLITYALGLFSVAAFNFLQRLFYALGQYRTPLYIGTATMLLDVCLSLILRETALRVRGLALANSIAFTVGLVIMIITVGKKHNIKLYSSLLREATKVVISSILVGLLCYAGFELFLYETWEYGSTIYNWLVTIGIGLVSVLILLSMYWMLHVQAFKQLIPGVLRRKLYETH